jgi:ABC-type molybdate transport system ATPase subunit
VQMADRIVVFDGGQLSEVGCAGYVSHPASFPAWITQVASTSVLHDCDRRAA